MDWQVNKRKLTVTWFFYEAQLSFCILSRKNWSTDKYIIPLLKTEHEVRLKHKWVIPSWAVVFVNDMMFLGRLVPKLTWTHILLQSIFIRVLLFFYNMLHRAALLIFFCTFLILEFFLCLAPKRSSAAETQLKYQSQSYSVMIWDSPINPSFENSHPLSSITEKYAYFSLYC